MRKKKKNAYSNYSLFLINNFFFFLFIFCIDSFYIDENTGTIRTSTTFVQNDLNGFFDLNVEAVDKETGIVANTVVRVRITNII